jgi:hypothetical protein
MIEIVFGILFVLIIVAAFMARPRLWPTDEEAKKEFDKRN